MRFHIVSIERKFTWDWGEKFNYRNLFN